MPLALTSRFFATEPPCKYTHTHTHTQWNTTQPLKNNEIMPFAAIFAAPRDYHIKLVRKKKTNTV